MSPETEKLFGEFKDAIIRAASTAMLPKEQQCGFDAQCESKAEAERALVKRIEELERLRKAVLENYLTGFPVVRKCRVCGKSVNHSDLAAGRELVHKLTCPVAIAQGP